MICGCGAWVGGQVPVGPAGYSGGPVGWGCVHSLAWAQGVLSLRLEDPTSFEGHFCSGPVEIHRLAQNLSYGWGRIQALPQAGALPTTGL